MNRTIQVTVLAALLLAAAPAGAVDVTLPETVPTAWEEQAELYGRLNYIPPARNAEVVAWERANADKLSPGFLFDLSKRLLDTEPAEALEWYSVAMMRGLYDAQRCIDTTARRAVSGLARQATIVQRYGQTHPQEFAEAGRRALARVDLFRHQVAADWVCAQGYTGMGGRSAGTKPPATWPAIEEQVRTDFTRQFTEMGER